MGASFYFKKFGLKPDLLILGKGMTAGHLPLSATLLAPRISEQYSRKKEKEALFHGHTYAGNPLSCRAAQAAMEIFSTSDFEKQLEFITSYFSQKISSLLHPNSFKFVKNDSIQTVTKSSIAI